jgi:hypothetical protein
MMREAQFGLSYSSADAKRVLVCLLGFEILLVFSYCVVHVLVSDINWGPIKLFVDLDREQSIPTWFSTVQLFTIAILLLLHARLSKQLRPYLILYGLGFMFLSLDEAAVIHEKIIDSATRLQWNWLLWLTFNGSNEAWMIPYVMIGLIVLLFSYRFFLLLWHDFRREAVLVVVGLTIFIIGGIVLELVAFHFEDAPTEKPYVWSVAGEEFLEMAGISVVLYGTLLLGTRIRSESLD